MSHYRFTNPDGTTLAWVNIDAVQAACPLGNGKISLQLSRTSLEVDAAQFEDALKKSSDGDRSPLAAVLVRLTQAIDRMAVRFPSSIRLHL